MNIVVQKFRKNLKFWTSDSRLQKSRTKPSHRAIALFFTIIFLQTLIPYNQLWANNNGPNAPEAAAFEPVDATDMVNLVTGNMSYVLPLLNVPSPEGGYPLALSYHAGIAMDQEASWVGLGWSLNPGAINRSVNGYPDDWGKTHVGEFFYHREWQENYYNFSVGGTLPNGITLGVGASWGSNQSFGGIVSIGYLGFTADIGIAGNSGYYGVGYSAGGFRYGMSTQGVSVGYGQSFGGVGANIGYNTNTGISGGISATGSYQNGIGENKAAGVGISFSSNGISVSGSNSSGTKGIGISNSNSTVKSGDYDIISKTRGLNLDFGGYWIGYRHKKVKFSLFKVNNLYVTGTLYPYKTNRLQRVLKDGGVYSTFFQEFNYLMDTYTFKEGSNNNSAPYVQPSYDNYVINAQGLSAIMQPRTFEEMVLYGKGEFETDANNVPHTYPLNTYDKYIVDTFNKNFESYNLNQKTNFYFTNSYNSFLRTKRSFSTLENMGSYDYESGFSALASKTNYSNDYSQHITPDGKYIRGGDNNYRKRGGAYIETFTNEEIRKNEVINFIDAKGISNYRNDTNIFLDEGIGAYRITTIDGKTYHYSLPVYHFESFYKNFKGYVNDNSNFFEQKKLRPYATHWLLTAVTGPDYFDKNNNGIIDKEDYGYWVEFEYGKWSDGFVWKGPKGNSFNTIKKRTGPWNNTEDITSSYTWGRKQIYYLDKIKTRTHTALFIKDLRSDNLSSSIQIFKEKYNGSESFDINRFGENLGYTKRRGFSLPGEILYDENNLPIEMPFEKVVGQHYPGNIMSYAGLIENQKYIDHPVTKSLKLSKIVLLNNKNLPTNIESLKSIGELTDVIEGNFYINDKYHDVTFSQQHHNVIETVNINETYFRNKKELKTVYSQLHRNVIDVSDIKGLNVEKDAIKVIEFNTNYKLGKNVPNSSSPEKRLLTLNSIITKGKEGSQVLPPYSFNYNKPDIAFNRSTMDNWGYQKGNPDAWSLNQIITPTGGRIKISYESDSYAIAAIAPGSGKTPITIIHHSLAKEIDRIEKNDDISNRFIKIFYKSDVNLEHDLSFYFTPDEITSVEFGRMVYDEFAGRHLLNKDNWAYYKVIETKGKEWILLEPIKEDVIRNFEFLITNTTPEGEYDSYLSYFQISNSKSAYIENDLNGKQRGGIRVKNIEVTDDSGNSLTTEYDYRNPINNVVSGITSYEPEDTYDDGYEDNIVNSKFISELPSPGVNYEFVKVSTKDRNDSLIGFSRYHFDVLKPIPTGGRKINSSNLVTNFIYSVQEDIDSPYVNYINNLGENSVFNFGRDEFSIFDKSSSIGRVLSIKNYNSKDQLISFTTNNYKDDLESDGEIGVTQESFLTYIQTQRNNYHPRKVIDAGTALVSKIYYPSVLESTITTQGSFSSTTYYDEHDFLTGQATQTTTVSSNGIEYLTKITPAYQIESYSNNTNGYSMGAKVDNPTNKNMLTQTAATITQIKSGEQWKTINADITTWNNDWTYRSYNGTLETPTDNTEKIWRKHKTFAWKGEVDQDGAYIGYTGNFDNFNWSNPDNQTNDKWINTSTTSLYDHYSMPLESIDINGNKASTKMGDEQSKIIAVGNAEYTEMYYSGAEYVVKGNTNYLDGEVKAMGAVTKVTDAHTGSYVMRSNGGGAFEVTLPANPERTGMKSKFKVSVWVRKGQENNASIRIQVGDNFPMLNYFSDNERVVAGSWVLLNGYINTSVNQTKITIDTNGNTDLDDFRIHPVSSSMTSYVYNEWDELTHIIGANNLATKYEYDSAGRLTKTYTEVIDTPQVEGGFKLTSSNLYNYKKQN